MSSEATFSLMHLSEISDLRQRIGQQFSSMARVTTQTSYMLYGQSASTIHYAHSPGHNLADTRTRIHSNRVLIMQPLPYHQSQKLRLQAPETLREIVEISQCDLQNSSVNLQNSSPASSYALGDVNDIDFRCSAAIFRIWRDMFASGGSLFGFSAVAPMRNGLSFTVSHFATDDGSIPELSMVFKATSSAEPACCFTFLCFFNCYWFRPGTCFLFYSLHFDCN